MAARNDMQVQPVQTTSAIGRPFTFVSGQFAGRTLRAELRILQNAEVGRKYARKDRRPLDPPPVMELRLFEIKSSGTAMQVEKAYKYDQNKQVSSDDDNSYLVCHVDIFPVQDDGQSDDHKSDADDHVSSTSYSTMDNSSVTSGSTSRSLSSLAYSSSSSAQYMPSFFGHQSYPTTEFPTLSTGYVQSSQSILAHAPFSSLTLTAPANYPQVATLHVLSNSQRGIGRQNVIAYYGDHPIYEGSKCTRDLVGTTFVQSQSIEYEGRRTLMFVFGDLAMRAEGTFIFRFRAFDISSGVSGRSDHPVLAECFSTPFKMHSTKDFPGLSASTDLTKHISLHGVRVRKRETERRRKKDSHVVLGQRIAPAIPPYTTRPAISSFRRESANWPL